MNLTRNLIGKRFEYIGDEIGTEFDRTSYKLTSIAIDTINFCETDSESYISPTKEEVNAHLEMGTLNLID